MARGASAAVGRDLRALFGAGTVAGLGDADLLGRFVSGGDGAEPAFAALVDRHAPGVFRVCRGVLNDPHDAEDAAQATFLVLARRASSVRRPDALACWLFGVALRVARRVRAEKARRHRHEARGAARAALHREDATRPESWGELHEELGRLPERYRRPLVLCHLEGLSYAEAARELRCPERTIHTRLIRGRALLKTRLIRRGLASSAAIVAEGTLAGVARAVEVPASWASATARAATMFATGGAAGTAATASLAQARGVLRAMMLAKIKLALLSTTIAAAALAGLLPLARGQKPPDPPPISQHAKPELPPEAKDQAARPKEGEFTVSVIANDSGKPLAGATLDVWMDQKHRILSADAEGRATWALSDRKFPDKEWGFDVWADGYVQQRYSFSDTNPRSPEAKGTFEVRLLPGEETFGGTVNDEDGRPIAGATVALFGHLGEMKDPHELAFKVDTRTDDQGRWRLNKNLRKMKWSFLYLSHPDFLADDELHARQFGDTDAKETAPELQPLRDFTDVQVMTKGVEVKARVLDTEGKPIGGASATWLMADNRGTLGNELRWEAADADGRVVFPHSRPGDLLLVARAPGHAPEMQPVKAESGTAETEIRLGPARTLAGHVVDTKNQPIAGAFVNVDNWRGFRGLRVYLATDRDGRFRWDEAPDESVLLNVSKAGHLDILFRKATPGSDFVFTLKRALDINGTVRDLETRKRIEQGTVEVGVVDPKDDSILWRAAESTIWIFKGNLHAGLDAEAAPAYRLRLKARGYEPFVTRVIRADEGDVTLDVVWSKIPQDGPVLVGQVLDPDGQPLAGARVAVAGSIQDGASLDDGILSGPPDRPLATTDAEGRFSIPSESMPVSPHYGIVVAHDRGYAEVSRQAFAADPTIAARPWARIEGVLKVGSRPAAGREVTYFFDRFGKEVYFVSGHGVTTTDTEGRFAFEKVAPGDIRVAPKYGTDKDRRGWSNGTLVEVQAGVSHRITVGGTGRGIVARIATPEGFDPAADYTTHSEFEVESDRPNVPRPPNLNAAERAAWSKVWLASPEGKAYRRLWVRRGQMKLQPDGTLRLDDLPPDHYRLHLTYSADPIHGRGGDPGRIAFADLKFEIPEGQSDEPLDLGVIRPQAPEPPKDGK